MAVIKIFGVDVEKHVESLKDTDKLSADLMKELVLRELRMKAHLEVVSQQCEEYRQDAERLNKLLQQQMMETANYE